MRFRARASSPATRDWGKLGGYLTTWTSGIVRLRVANAAVADRVLLTVGDARMFRVLGELNHRRRVSGEVMNATERAGSSGLGFKTLKSVCA